MVNRSSHSKLASPSEFFAQRITAVLLALGGKICLLGPFTLHAFGKTLWGGRLFLQLCLSSQSFLHGSVLSASQKAKVRLAVLHRQGFRRVGIEVTFSLPFQAKKASANVTFESSPIKIASRSDSGEAE